MKSILFRGCKKKLYGITNCYDPTEIVTNKKENKTKIDVPKGNVISLGRIKINFFFGCVLIRFSVPSPGFSIRSIQQSVRPDVPLMNVAVAIIISPHANIKPFPIKKAKQQHSAHMPCPKPPPRLTTQQGGEKSNQKR